MRNSSEIRMHVEHIFEDPVRFSVAADHNAVFLSGEDDIPALYLPGMYEPVMYHGRRLLNLEEFKVRTNFELRRFSEV